MMRCLRWVTQLEWRKGLERVEKKANAFSIVSTTDTLSNRLADVNDNQAFFPVGLACGHCGLFSLLRYGVCHLKVIEK